MPFLNTKMRRVLACYLKVPPLPTPQTSHIHTSTRPPTHTSMSSGYKYTSPPPSSLLPPPSSLLPPPSSLLPSPSSLLHTDSSGYQQSSLMVSESDTEEEILMDSTKKTQPPPSPVPTIKNNKLSGGDKYGKNSAQANSSTPK